MTPIALDQLLEPDSFKLVQAIKERGILSNQSLMGLISFMDLNDDQTRHYAIEYNIFLVMEHLRACGKVSDSPDYLFPIMKNLVWGTYLKMLPEDRKNIQNITTPEELESVSALVLAAAKLEIHDIRYIKSSRIIVPKGGTVNTMRIKNHHLSEFIRYNPEQMEEVVSYVKERGLERGDRALSGYYESRQETHDSLNSGWL